MFYCPTGPTNPELIARKNLISFSYGMYQRKFDGLLEFDGRRFHIYCDIEKSGDSHSPKSRFTFCHELGHYFIDHHRLELESGRSLYHPSRCEFQSKLLVEREADCFGGYLLMPKQKFIRSAQMWKSKSGLDLVKQLSSYFKSSLTSTAFRLAKENFENCGVFKWDTKGNLSWYWLCDEFFGLGLGLPCQTINQVGDQSTCYKAMHQKHSLTDDVYRKSKTPLSFFFPKLTSQTSKTPIVQEESMQLGQFGFLTYIFSPQSKNPISL